MIESGILNAEISVEELIESDEQSIFWGLVRLQELSLKDNALETPASLQGLSYFNFGPKYSNILKPTLMHLWLNENPYQIISAMKKKGEEFLRMSLPFLKTLDDKELNSVSELSSVEVSKILRDNASSGGSSTVGGTAGFENMEKEYLSALKEERDTTIVA